METDRTMRVSSGFRAIGSYRAKVSQLDDLSLLGNKAACMWNMLQCHRIVLSFKDMDYQGHPGVVTTTNLFLLMEGVNPMLLTANEDKIKCLESQGKAASAELKGLNEKCKRVKRDFTA
jgi:hypothetical protein